MTGTLSQDPQCHPCHPGTLSQHLKSLQCHPCMTRTLSQHLKSPPVPPLPSRDTSRCPRVIQPGPGTALGIPSAPPREQFHPKISSKTRPHGEQQRFGTIPSIATCPLLGTSQPRILPQRKNPQIQPRADSQRGKIAAGVSPGGVFGVCTP